MEKIETSLETLRRDIGTFYLPSAWHFVTINGIDLCDGTIELQWIFSAYGEKDHIVVFFAVISDKERIPSVTDLIPSAFMGEREIVDLFGLDIEGTKRGLYLDEDSATLMPLRCQS